MIKMVALNMEGILLRSRNSWNNLMNKLSKNSYYNIRYSFEYLYDNMNNKLKVSINNNEFDKIIKDSFDYSDINDGIDDFVSILHRNNIYVSIITEGVKQYADILASDYNFDYYIANEAKIVNGKIRFIKNVDPLRKDIALNKIKNEFNIKSENIMTIGSSIADASMKYNSKYFMAFNPEYNDIKKYATKTFESDNVSDILNIKIANF